MREPAGPKAWVVAGPLAARLDGTRVRLQDLDIRLTASQALVLVALMRRRGHLARHADIYKEVFGRRLPPRSRAIDLHIARIRAALGPHAASIITVGRVGYRLEADTFLETPRSRDGYRIPTRNKPRCG